jgi:hypothetical protein
LATLRRSGKLWLGVVTTLLLTLVGSAAADGPALPPFTGAMTFKSIQGPDGPEEYSWEVQLDEEQELVQVDERHAKVMWSDGVHVAFWITAVEAHDAEGAAVPTTIAVSDGNVLTLTVHHRDGNPAAGGASFHYPVVAGVGWEGGFHTHYVQMPPGEMPPVPAQCVVPKLTGRSLAGSRARLATANCQLGAVRGKRSKGAKVVKQFRAPGTVLADGTRVAVKLGS